MFPRCKSCLEQSALCSCEPSHSLFKQRMDGHLSGVRLPPHALSNDGVKLNDLQDPIQLSHSRVVQSRFVRLGKNKATSGTL